MARAQELRLGDGAMEETDVGPLVNEAALRKVESYMSVAREEGTIVLGGSRVPGDGSADGFFLRAHDRSWREAGVEDGV